ncbi:MAG TPA: efflux transporter outer membrane subunit [Arenimonas sp.]|uniref:efflux transporter outer membrane subunit n=1 Tax=Arenimonas sp. TaxID=1872635 RepID=UPI002CACABCE|nr:efflux transporter outer membrane subunit [Arenimonas sp.]HMB56464.1 efflux transporter outer membrane subunit [Arenimonas sp.]
MRNSLQKTTIAAAVFGALLSACAVGPNHVRPMLDLPEKFSEAGALAPVTAAATHDDESQFWRRLGDAQLTALIEQALVANHDLRIALANAERAQALQRGTRLDVFPTITGEGSASDARASADQQPGLARADRDGRQTSVVARAAWELDLFGRVRRQVEAGRAGTDAASADFRALQVVIVAEVARSYIELRGLQEQLRVAQESAESQAETLRLVEMGFRAGRGSEFDTARARALLAGTQSRAPALEARIAITLHHLAVLTGQPPGIATDGLKWREPLPAQPGVVDPGTPGDLLRRRPDIAAAEYRLRAATARIGVAKADFFPRFTLGGLIGSQAVDRDALFGRDSETRLVALGVDWSFLDVGRVRARVAAADADAAAELARYEQTVLRALADTEDALVRYGNARAEDEHLARAAADSARAAQLARIRYENGATDLFEVLDAERSNLQAQDALAQSRTRSLTGWVSLYQALAGGWPDNLPRRVPVAVRSP